MGTETLVIPEENILEVVKIIRNGIAFTHDISEQAAVTLSDWCREMENYYSKDHSYFVVDTPHIKGILSTEEITDDDETS